MRSTNRDHIVAVLTAAMQLSSYARTAYNVLYKEGMDQWLLAVTSYPAAKGSAKDLKVAGAGPVHCYFSLPPFFPYHV